MPVTLYLNGEYMPLEQGRVSVEDRGFQFADGVYEVVRSFAGKPFLLKEHLRRLERSLAFLEIPLPEPLAKIEEVFRRLAGDLPEALIYAQVTRGAAPRVHAFPKAVRPTFLAYAREYKPDPPEKTYALLSVRDDRWAHCDIKSIALLANTLAKEKAARAGCDEGLFVREDGTVTEGCSTNFFIVRGGAVVTHPANDRILHGITRAEVIRVARDAGLSVLEETFGLNQALAAEEAFIASTGHDVMPVRTIDGHAVGRSCPGPVTARLRGAFREFVRRALA